MHWQWQRFEDLSVHEIYEMMVLRQKVFVVEQDCAYLDADNLDQQSWHLTARSDNGNIVAYARLSAPGSRFSEASIGRVLTDSSARGKGFAKGALKRAIAKSRIEYAGQGLKISAQFYLVPLYTDFGFEIAGEPYDEDGIEHIDMILGENK